MRRPRFRVMMAWGAKLLLLLLLLLLVLLFMMLVPVACTDEDAPLPVLVPTVLWREMRALRRRGLLRR